MEAIGKIISIMTRWRRCDAVHGDQITRGNSEEYRAPSVLGERTHVCPFSLKRSLKYSRASEQEESVD